jgi:hypothetical protein
LTFALDAGDNFPVEAGQFFSQAANVTTFYSNAELTNEIARVAVV